MFCQGNTGLPQRRLRYHVTYHGILCPGASLQCARSLRSGSRAKVAGYRSQQQHEQQQHEQERHVEG